MAVALLGVVLVGCSGSSSGSSDQTTTAGSPSTSGTTAGSTPSAASTSKPAAGGGSSALFASGSNPCKTVDGNALGQAAGMTLVKSIPSADNGCLWGTSKVGVGVQVSIHPKWTDSFVAVLKAPHPGSSKATDVSLPGASSAVVIRAGVSGSELDNLYAIFPQGGVEVAVTGPPAVATVAAAVASAGVILG
jgi:hypothetical protein